MEQENFALTQESQQKSQTICDLKQENEKLKGMIKVQCHKCRIGDTTEDNYRKALEEIRDNFMLFRSCMIPFHIGSKETLPHSMADAIQDYCDSIKNKINEVLS